MLDLYSAINPFQAPSHYASPCFADSLEPPDTLEIQVQLYLGNHDLVVDSSYNIGGDSSIAIQEVKFFLGKPVIEGATGSRSVHPSYPGWGKSLVYFFNAREDVSATLRCVVGPTSQGVLLLPIGVPAQDENGVPLDHTKLQYPLGVTSDMYWRWSSSYAFAKIEGKTWVNGSIRPFYFHFDSQQPLQVRIPLNRFRKDGAHRLKILLALDVREVVAGKDGDPSGYALNKEARLVDRGERAIAMAEIFASLFRVKL